MTPTLTLTAPDVTLGARSRWALTLSESVRVRTLRLGMMHSATFVDFSLGLSEALAHGLGWELHLLASTTVSKLIELVWWPIEQLPVLPAGELLWWESTPTNTGSFLVHMVPPTPQTEWVDGEQSAREVVWHAQDGTVIVT